MLKMKPVFTRTHNVRNFGVIMDALALGEGEGRLGMVHGRAGRGKTRTAQWWHAENGGVYLRVATVWRTSELEFLRVLCRELGVISPPHRKGPAFQMIVDKMIEDPRPVMVDEIEKMPGYFLDVIRDISDMSTAPFVLIGEDELVPAMKRNRRVWSRTYQRLQFEPIREADIIHFAQQAAGVKLTPAVAKIFFDSSEGDFRLVRRDLLNLVHMANARQTTDVDADMAKIAVKQGLSG